MNQLLTTLREALHTSASFEDAAESLLHAVMSLTNEVIDESRIRNARLLRGIVHLRPAGAYKSLVVVGDSATEAGELLPSATLWAWLERHLMPTWIDVQLGVVTVIGEAPVKLESRTGGVDVFASQAQLLERRATHIMALPLREGDRLMGMVSLEADARRSIGDDFVWPDIAEPVQLALDLAAHGLLSKPASPPAEDVAPDELLPVIGKSMQRQIKLLRIFAQQNETVLLAGPTGSGKSRMAEWCHSQSPRADRAFLQVDLNTVPEDMQLAELFGWRRGAFTGAIRDHDGLVARAERGTLFLDEIDKLSLKAQAGLLRFLEERQYRRLGEGDLVRSDVRIIVGTNADLQSVVASGEFREDLFYRINVLPVRLRELSARRDEIAGWAAFMAERRHAEGAGTGRVEVSEAALKILQSEEWPGNLRQLDNVIRRAYAIALMESGKSSPTISGFHLESAMGFERGPTQAQTLLRTLTRAARAYVAAALKYNIDGEPLTLDMAEVFKGLVIQVALDLAGGDKEEVMRLLGKASLLQGRNHYKLINRELSRLAKFTELEIDQRPS